ncbi:MAG: ATPase, partial [Clostridiales bacterium]|nr:ATPase [Clostridiales bacterium]
MRYVLGIDQGGSKTYAMVADEQGELLSFGSAGGASHFASGLESAIKTICDASWQAIHGAGITL